MTGLASPSMRRCVAALLAVVLMLTGIGRSLAAVPTAPASSVVIAGHVIQLCAMPADEGTDPSGSHRDCDQCPLCAPVILPGSPPAPLVLRIERIIEADAVRFETPDTADPRSPRQSQGPPAA